MTDAGLKELAGLKSLQSLNLAQHAGDGRGAEGTGRAEELAIAGPYATRKVTDAGLKELAGLKSLQSLDLGQHASDGRGAEGTGRG